MDELWTDARTQVDQAREVSSQPVALGITRQATTGQPDPPPGPAALIDAAAQVLDHNWTGRCTLPSRGLYPHQWSWDAAFIAIGRAWTQQRRAQQELESLLDAQWASGMVPHIVFDPGVPPGSYFPGPEFWQAERAAGSPGARATSGITQPPLHARAALEVYRRAADREEALAFLRRLYPRLCAQHEYLATRRDPDGRGLACIVHPWESGTDNSPLWDEELAEMVIPPGALPPYQRRDLLHADPADRPTNDAYDRFVYLAITYRDSGYDDAAMVDSSPFLIEDPLFNSIWCWSAHALAEIAELLGEDPGPHRELAGRIHDGMLKYLWDPSEERFYAYDLRDHRQVRKQAVATILPLLDPELPADVTGALVRTLDSPHFRAHDHPEHYLVPSYDLRSPDFDRRRYWRGPVWVNINWLLWCGLQQHGTPPVAHDIVVSTLHLVQRSGFREYFDPFTASGYGGTDFSWTAALLIDLLRADAAGVREELDPSGSSG